MNSKKRSLLLWPSITLGGIVLYVVLDVVLTYLRPDYNPLHNAESDYGRGPYAWLMDINFLIRCGFSLSLVKTIWATFSTNIAVKRASYWLLAWATASGALAFFADNPYGYPHVWSGSVHLVLALTAFLSVLFAMFLINRQLRSIKSWQKYTVFLTIIAVLAVLSAVLLGHSGFGPHKLGGLYERIFLGLVIVWEGIIAARVMSAKKSLSRRED